MRPARTILFLLLLLVLGFLIFVFIQNQTSEIVTELKNPPKPGISIAISIDLCPSSKPYNKGLFDYLDGLSKTLGYPIPVAICPSGTWLLKHPKELTEIKSKDLDITWVNHSYSHPVEHDFLNNPRIDFKYEVEENLKVFEKYGIKPSEYFRFPGLRSNQKRLKELAALGYIPFGANAWLAKGQRIKNGSIILVHGNGNEPRGVDILLQYLKEHQKELQDGQIRIISI